MIWVNFKTYPQASGENALDLAEICFSLQEKFDKKIIPVVQVADVAAVKQHFPQLEVWIQHLDPYPPGAYTGSVNLENLISAGALGTLLNHAEHQIPPGTIKQTISRIKNKELGVFDFKTMVCLKTLGQAEKIKKFNPDFIAYEPPELIGGDLSVSKAKPEVIKRIVDRIKEIPIIVGAGIKTKEDIKRSFELGAKGVLVSSGIVLAKNPEEALEQLLTGIPN